LHQGQDGDFHVVQIVSGYLTSDSQPVDLQTLCYWCKLAAEKDLTADFRTDKTPLTQPLAAFPRLLMPSSNLKIDAWQRFIRRAVNVYYRCAAVDFVDIASKGERFHHWRVCLRPGNDPDLIKPHLKELLQSIRKERKKAGHGMPNTLTVDGEDSRSVVAEA
jgi:hypothetical protein